MQKDNKNPFVEEITKFIIEETERAVERQLFEKFSPLEQTVSLRLDRMEARVDKLFETRAPSDAITDLSFGIESSEIVATAKCADGQTIRHAVLIPTIMAKGVYDKEAKYARLDLIVQNGGSFLAISDAPGPCPGPSWQMVGSRGKQGRTGKAPTQGELRQLIAEAAR